MQNPAQESAMTEVALALAMGFFSLMVLTLISMGVESDRSEKISSKSARVLDLASNTKGATPASIEPLEKDIILIFDGQNFRSPNMKIADLEWVKNQARSKGRRIIMAVDPTLPFNAALAAREQLPLSNLVVSQFSEKWRKALALEQGGQHVQN